jgi:hypothetical protein
MTRSQLDRAGTAMAAILGAFLILASLPFAVYFFQQEQADGTTYTLLWSTDEAGEASASVDTGSSRGTATLGVEDALVARVMLHFGTCEDQFRPELQQQAASITWVLRESVEGGEGRELGNGTYTCADVPDDVSFNMTGTEAFRPGELRAASAGEAEAAAWMEAAAGNVTVEYVLELTAERAPGNLPNLPGGNLNPTLEAAVDVMVEVWSDLTATEEQEVLR